MPKKIVVLGGGVVGVCCALQLQRIGYTVTIIERNPFGESAIQTSCGHIAVSEVIPLSKPANLLKSPAWLFDPTGPLAIRPSSLLGVLPWFLRFVGNARPNRISKISRDLSCLTMRAMEDYRELLGVFGLSDLIKDFPVIELYDTEEDLQHGRPYHDVRRSLGFQLDEISGSEAAEIEPEIANDFAKAVVFNDWRSIVDGKRFVTAMTDAFVAGGGSFKICEASHILHDGHVGTGISLEGGEQIDADVLVLSAGAWTKQLATPLGVNLMIEGVAGYQTSIADPGISLGHGIIYEKGGFGVTQYESGLSISGSIEFAKLNAKPDWRRADILVRKAQRILPNLRQTEGIQRIGRRPLTPDTLPIIDQLPNFPNVFVATGHGQLGVTLGATTGKLITDLVSGKPTDIDITPYGASRF
jgi:D-amino-acid dehydrogenase